jgi:hypothetical protein
MMISPRFIVADAVSGEATTSVPTFIVGHIDPEGTKKVVVPEAPAASPKPPANGIEKMPTVPTSTNVGSTAEIFLKNLTLNPLL